MQAPVSLKINRNNASINLAKKICHNTDVKLNLDENAATIVDQGKQWVDMHGMLHIRSQIGENSPVSGDFVGLDRHHVFNVDINDVVDLVIF